MKTRSCHQIFDEVYVDPSRVGLADGARLVGRTLPSSAFQTISPHAVSLYDVCVSWNSDETVSIE